MHARVADLRGFGSVEEHDEHLVERWNARVAAQDTVWHLGDVTLKPFREVRPFLDRLNGTKHLITGNHDSCWPGHRQAHKHQREWLEVFDSVQSFARRRIDGRDVLLSHFPFAGDHTSTERYLEYRLRDTGMWLLHGHVHDAWRVNGKQINVGVDAWGMAPVLMDEIAAIIREGNR